MESGETPAEAAVREVWEEIGLDVRVVRHLWEGVYGDVERTSPEYCFLVER
ncbi:NUDIX domain-containing protein [Capsulimonas corticalis]|uniref:NUDIX domain-containing protein n=1 Tax=Capsulimonas corticalis TaxID=2219043 RepID=UPI003F4BBB9D